MPPSHGGKGTKREDFAEQSKGRIVAQYMQSGDFKLTKIPKSDRRKMEDFEGDKETQIEKPKVHLFDGHCGHHGRKSEVFGGAKKG